MNSISVPTTELTDMNYGSILNKPLSHMPDKLDYQNFTETR